MFGFHEGQNGHVSAWVWENLCHPDGTPYICTYNLRQHSTKERAAIVNSVLGMWMRSELIEVPATLYVNHQPPFCPQTPKRPRAGPSQCCKQRASKPGKTPNASRGRQLSNTLSLALVERLDRVFWLVFGQKVSGLRQQKQR